MLDVVYVSTARHKAALRYQDLPLDRHHDFVSTVSLAGDRFRVARLERLHEISVAEMPSEVPVKMASQHRAVVKLRGWTSRHELDKHHVAGC